MLRISSDKLVEITSGEVIGGDVDLMISDVAVDSRRVTLGCAFVALVGEHVDGHDFVIEAIRAGARAVLVTRGAERLAAEIDAAARRGVLVVRVADCVAALGSLAAYHRTRLHAIVVGVTGSTGKTSTKDFIRSVLGTTVRVVANEGNRNNEIGLPLTVLRAGSDTDVLVVEMGMRGLGQIAGLARIARPDFGVVTNVGTSHMELLGDQEAIAQAKGELVEAIPASGAVFLNGDDAYSTTLTERSAAPVTLYGLGASCDVRAIDVETDGGSKASFTLVSAQGDAPVALSVTGRHNVYNALAAAAVGLRLAIPIQSIVEGLSAAQITGMRMETFTTASGVNVINDAYNANPTSMKAALECLAGFDTPGRRIAVLGDMGELGSFSELAHFKLGEVVPTHGVDVLVTVGDRARRIAEGARAEGMSEDVIRICATADEASEVLDDLLEAGDTVLVKASRFMGLERVVEGIVTPRVG